MKTHIGIVLDMSGSMSSTEQEVKSGLKSYIKEQQKDNPKALLSVTAFDTLFEHWVDGVPIELIRPAPLVGRYKPRGATALLDAVGNTINNMKADVKGKDKAIVVIMTDGYENASQEYTRDQIKKLITSLAKKNWTFIFLGANIDSFAEANRFGIPWGNTASYSYGVGTVNAFKSLGAVTSTLSSSTRGSTATAFSDAEQSQNYVEGEENGNK
jgi:uncharacterized protein YegL